MFNKFIRGFGFCVCGRFLFFFICGCLSVLAGDFGQDSNFPYQSNKGRKTAVVVGANVGQLKGSEFDAGQMADYLKNKARFDTVILLTGLRAKRADILKTIEEQLGVVKAGDLFTFYFSGHGILFPDEYSLFLDETREIRYENQPGKYDNALVPVDYKLNDSGKNWGNLILDDELFEIFAKFTKNGCFVLVLADSCHAGNLTKAVLPFETEEPAFVVKSLSFSDIFKNTAKWSKTVQKPNFEVKDLNNKYLAFTAAKDEQAAGEIRDNSLQSRGLFTYSILEVLKNELAPPLYQNLLLKVVEKTKKFLKDSPALVKTEQTPYLDTEFFPNLACRTLFLQTPDESEQFLRNISATPTGEQNQIKATIQLIPAEEKNIMTRFKVEIFGDLGSCTLESVPLAAGLSDEKGYFIATLPLLGEGKYWVRIKSDNKIVFEGYQKALRLAGKQQFWAIQINN